MKGKAVTRRARKVQRRTISRQGITRPDDTDETLSDIAKRLIQKQPAQRAASKAAAKETVVFLKRSRICVAARAFQWRRFGRNLVPSDDHILDLAKAVQRGDQLPPILVFPVLGSFYVVDGHHRLAGYDTARWKKDIPALIFSGTLEDAYRAALAANNVNKLPMNLNDRTHAAWTLVKKGDPRDSIASTAKLSKVSTGTVDNMRRVWRKLNDGSHGEPHELQALSWSQAQMKAKGIPEDREHGDWLEAEADKLVSDIVRAKLGTRLTKNPDITGLALAKLNENLPAALVEMWRQEPAFDPHAGGEDDVEF
jgi:phage gp16-like protein